METVFERLSAQLDRQQAEYRVMRHEPVYTSEEAAAVRGATLSSGAKALVCKVDRGFVLIVLPANLKLASKRVRKARGVKSLRFASREEVSDITALQPGSIPPFGSLFELPTWCDHRLAAEATINFNAGDHAISINMPYAEFVRVEQPLLGDFGDPPAQE